MKTSIILIFNFLFFLNSFAQQKFERPPKAGKEKTAIIKNILPNKKGHLILNFEELQQNEGNLYCYLVDSECNIIDGKTTLYSYYLTSGNDTPTSIQYNFAEGEFLEGKYQGIWKYYHKNGKINYWIIIFMKYKV